MRLYEGFFIFQPEATSETRKNEEKSLEDMIQRFGGSITQKTECGKKLLGYPLRKFREGFFLLVDFRMPPASISDFRNTLQLYEALLHFMITLKEEKAQKRPEASGMVAGEKAARVSPSQVS